MGCQTLQRIASASGTRKQVWKGSVLPTDQQGIKVLGTPSHRICGRSSRSRLGRSPHTVGAHSRGAGRAVCTGFAPPQRSRQGQLPRASRQRGTHRDCGSVHVKFSGRLQPQDSSPLALGGLGRQSAHWACWADTLPMVRSRHRAMAEAFVEVLETGVKKQKEHEEKRKMVPKKINPKLKRKNTFDTQSGTRLFQASYLCKSRKTTRNFRG